MSGRGGGGGKVAVTSYCLDVDGHGEISWYHDHQLSLPNAGVQTPSEAR